MNEEDVLHIYKGTLLSCKKELKNALCSDTDGPRDYNPNWSKSKTNTVYYHLCVEYKMDTNELFTK